MGEGGGRTLWGRRNAARCNPIKGVDLKPFFESMHVLLERRCVWVGGCKYSVAMAVECMAVVRCMAVEALAKGAWSDCANGLQLCIIIVFCCVYM